MGDSGGGDISVEFSVVTESSELFAGDATMGEIPTVEMAVEVRFSRSGDGWWGKGSGGIWVVATVPVVSIVFGELRSTGWCSRKRR